MQRKKTAELSIQDMLGEWGIEEEEEEDQEVTVPKVVFQPFRRKAIADDIFVPEQSAGHDETEIEEGAEANIEEDQADEGEGEGDEAEGDDYQTERAARERTSGFANDEGGPMEGQNPRMFYAIRNMNRSEEDLFLDVYEKWCYSQTPKVMFNRQQHPFLSLLQNHPHPKFLNIPLCVATNAFYNDSTRKYEWNTSLYERLYKDMHAPHDILRYIYMFSMYS